MVSIIPNCVFPNPAFFHILQLLQVCQSHPLRLILTETSHMRSPVLFLVDLTMRSHGRNWTPMIYFLTLQNWLLMSLMHQLEVCISAQLRTWQALMQPLQPSMVSLNLVVRYLYIAVSVIPVFSQSPEDINVTITEDLVLECTADGFPLPSIEWTHNGTVVQADDRITITEVVSMEVSLISRLTVSDTSLTDSGEYRCTAMSTTPFTDVNSSLALVLIQGQPILSGVCVQNLFPSQPLLSSHRISQHSISLLAV